MESPSCKLLLSKIKSCLKQNLLSYGLGSQLNIIHSRLLLRQPVVLEGWSKITSELNTLAPIFILIFGRQVVFNIMKLGDSTFRSFVSQRKSSDSIKSLPEQMHLNAKLILTLGLRWASLLVKSYTSHSKPPFSTRAIILAVFVDTRAIREHMGPDVQNFWRQKT